MHESRIQQFDRDITYIVVPALNEEQHIGETLKRIRAAGYNNIVVVDDGSSDKTAAIAQKDATVIRHPISCGYGAALNTGGIFAIESGARIIVHFDGDGQFNASEIDSMILPLCKGVSDIVFGSRYLEKTETKLPMTKRIFIHKPALLLQNMTTGLHFTDVHNGFRSIARHALSRMKLKQDKMAYASEIIAEVKRLGLRYSEVPVTIAYREYGQGFIGGLRIFRDLIIKRLL